MVGGESVLFDLELNCKTKKTEAKRVKLAPLNTNLKNDKNKSLNGTQVENYFRLFKKNIFFYLSSN